jgi:hypothetical protein
MRAPIGTKRAAHPSRRVPAPRPHQPDHDLTLSAEQAPPEGAARRQLAGPGAGRRSRSSEQRSIIRNSGSNPWRQCVEPRRNRPRRGVAVRRVDGG